MTKLKYDKPLLAGLIGMISFIPVELFTQILKYFGLTKLSGLEFTSMIMVLKPNLWVGMLSGPGVGGLAGIIIYYSAKLLGNDYLPIKGGAIGAVTYGFIDVLMGVIANNAELQQGTTGHFVHASAAIIGGSLGGLLINKYLLQPDDLTTKIRARRFLVVPLPTLKREHKKKRVRFVKPKKL